MCSNPPKSFEPFLDENRVFCCVAARKVSKGAVGKRPGRWFRRSSLGFQCDLDRELSTQPVTRKEKSESQEFSSCMFVFLKGNRRFFVFLALFEGGDEEFDFNEDEVIGDYKRSQGDKQKNETSSSGLWVVVFIFWILRR